MFRRRHRTTIIDIFILLFGAGWGLIIFGALLRVLMIITCFLDVHRFVFTHELINQAINTTSLYGAICAIAPYLSICVGIYKLLTNKSDKSKIDD